MVHRLIGMELAHPAVRAAVIGHGRDLTSRRSAWRAFGTAAKKDFEAALR
jgi:hypothetical protein